MNTAAREPIADATVSTDPIATQSATLDGDALQAADVAETHVAVAQLDEPSRLLGVMSPTAKLAPHTVRRVPPETTPLAGLINDTTGAVRYKGQFSRPGQQGLGKGGSDFRPEFGARDRRT